MPRRTAGGGPRTEQSAAAAPEEQKNSGLCPERRENDYCSMILSFSRVLSEKRSAVLICPRTEQSAAAAPEEQKEEKEQWSLSGKTENDIITAAIISFSRVLSENDHALQHLIIFPCFVGKKVTSVTLLLATCFLTRPQRYAMAGCWSSFVARFNDGEWCPVWYVPATNRKETEGEGLFLLNHRCAKNKGSGEQ